MEGVRGTDGTAICNPNVESARGLSAYAEGLGLGRPEVYPDPHLMLSSGGVDAVWILSPNYAMMEQSRGATNIVAISPWTVIAYRRNRRTNKELRDHGVNMKEWDDSLLNLLGGPHCSTCPLWRDPA